MTTFVGKPCKKCGGTERYMSGKHNCVACSKKNSQRRHKLGEPQRWAKENAERVNAANRRKYKDLTQEEKRVRNRKQQLSLYGLTLDDYSAMLVEQSGVCAICGKEEAVSSKGVLSVDHDHKSGKVRGLLCDTCNRGLGHFFDNTELLTKAVLYLEQQCE